VEIHNIAEDNVLEIVADMFETESRKRELGFCTCHQCLMDVACYVLNRLPQEYVVSGRGVAYASKDYQVNIQRQADAVTLASEGWRKIQASKRPHFDHRSAKQMTSYPAPPVFNYPTIIGRLFDGTTFAPMNGIQVSLLREGKEAAMIDPNWQNPCSLFSSTGGTFIFWPAPEKADSGGESRIVEFELRAKADGFEPLAHFFSLRVNAEMSVQDQFSLQRQFTLPDLTIFPA
jgi:competence protein ComFB